MASIAPRPSDTLLPRVAVVAFAVLQVLTPTLPFLGIGEPIGTRSNAVQTLITPAGWAFSIWGPLYAGCLLFAVYQALPAQQSREALARLRWPAAGAFLGNAAWAAYVQVGGLDVLSSVIILWTLACLLVIYRLMADGRQPLSAGYRWCASVPLSALTGWLTAASIVNIAASLRFHGVEGGAATPLIAAGVLIVGGVIAAVALVRSRGNLAYTMVFLWALAAILAAGGRISGAVAAATVAAALFVIAGAIVGRYRYPEYDRSVG